MSIRLRTASDLASYLGAEYKERHTRNPNYSHRAFARDLSVSASHLSDVLRGRGGLSREAALVASETLNLNETEREFLWSMIESQFGRTDLKRRAAKSRLKTLREKSRANQLPNEIFRVVSDWYHFAILEMAQLKSFKLDNEHISNWLGIGASEAKAALERMSNIGLAKIVAGKLEVSDLIKVGQEIPSQAIRDFHKQILVKAGNAVEGQDVAKRVLSSNIVAISNADMPRARAAVQEFVDSFISEFSVGGNKDHLYALSLQFFDLKNEDMQ